MGVDGESGWRVVMTSQTVGRLPALSRPARDEPTETTTDNNNRGQNSDGDREPVSGVIFNTSFSLKTPTELFEMRDYILI